MSHRAEVQKFIDNVKSIVGTEEAILIMKLLGATSTIGNICAAVEYDMNIRLTIEERLFISTEIFLWLQRLKDGTECFCGKCGKGPKKVVNVKPESATEWN